MKILLIEESTEEALRLKTLLEGLFADFVVVESTEKSINILNEDKSFDIIIIGNVIPKNSGISFSRFVKNNENLMQIPVIFVSVPDDDGIILECFDSMADDCIIGPVNTDTLQKRILGILKKCEECDFEVY